MYMSTQELLNQSLTSSQWLIVTYSQNLGDIHLQIPRGLLQYVLPLWDKNSCGSGKGFRDLLVGHDDDDDDHDDDDDDKEDFFFYS